MKKKYQNIIVPATDHIHLCTNTFVVDVIELYPAIFLLLIQTEPQAHLVPHLNR